MGFTLTEWAKKQSDELTFIQLKAGIVLWERGYQVPFEGIYVPILTTEMAQRIQMGSEDEVVTVPSIIRGILFLTGFDTEFRLRESYELMIDSAAEDVKAIAYDAAKSLEKEGDLSKAVLILRGYHQLKPNDDQAAIKLAALYVRFAGSLENPEDPLITQLMQEALTLLEERYADHRQDVLLHYYLGTVYQWQKTYQKAEKIWQQSLQLQVTEKERQMIEKKIKNNDLLARYEEGYQLILHGNASVGLEKLLPLVERDPEWWNLHFFVAMGYQQQGLIQEAIRHYGRVLEIRGFHQQTAIELSEIYLAKGESEKAMQWMEETLLQNPGQPDLLCRMALMKAMSGNIRESLDLVSQAEDAGGEETMIAGVREQINAIVNG